jgi:hypothetical protein
MAVTRLAEFDTWREGYAGALVTIYRAGTSTLADVFLNEELTNAAENPITLVTLTLDERSYGKWPAPLYTEQAVELNIDSIDSTGIIRPALTTLDGEDASDALVTPDGASEAHTLAEHLARVIYAVDYGEFIRTGEPGASSLTNNTTLETAIGAAGAQGGGVVMLPPGVYDIIEFILPPGVVLEGVDEEATFLQTTYAGPVIGLSGAGCGLRNLTLDGVSQEGNSVGVYAIAADDTVMDNVTIKRFETGNYRRGGERNVWNNLTVSDCIIGAKLHGDLNAGAGGGGEVWQGNRWDGGVVELCIDTGIELKREDAACIFNELNGLTFRDNTGSGLRIRGARSTVLENCLFAGNITNIDMEDETPVDEDNTVIGFIMRGGQIAEGESLLEGTLSSVIFDSVEFIDCEVTLTSPQNNVLALDCREDSNVIIGGSATHWTRASRLNYPAASFGLTTGNAPTKAWALTLRSGQQVLIESKIIGRQRNGANRAFYWLINDARRAPATLAYDTQTGNFTVGNILTGATSGATARIVADSDSGTTGTLSLVEISKAFLDNEIITDGATGSATANGTQTEGATSVGTTTAVRTAVETDASWAADIVANGPEIEIRVTGATAQTIEWTVEAAVTST